MDIQIRKSTPNEVPTIVRLMRDFAEFEDLGDYCEITEDRLFNVMFGDEGFVEGLVAFHQGEAVAYALFYPYFASFRGQCGFYLEDIFIAEDFRRNGLGEAMVRIIARLAKQRGYERIDFQVLEWNAPAVKFYEKLGALRDDSERHFKFIDKSFQSLVV
ncbi:MAG TPA: GNAT family N-acetyltransferase [Pyrinomonadaceae bacterium]|nr:GNAT family N-acetyltransferase [Pyrinomonadaceae bacterium]